MKIGVVGAGAVGLYYGARLQNIGEDVHFLLRSDLEAIQERGIEVRAGDGNFKLSQVRGYGASKEIGVCDLVLIALKATANECLPELLRPMVGQQSVLLTLQNGLGNDSFLAEQFPNNTIFGGLCFVCINRLEPGVVENYLLGKIGLGVFGRPADSEVEAVGDLLSRSGANARVTDDLLLMQWKKLVWNVPFNGLAIVGGGVTTDVILQSPELLEEAKLLMMEIIEGAAAYGKEIPQSFADKQIEITGPMGAYKPSSLLDFLEARPVEVEAIWGEPLRRGEAMGVEMPRLRNLYERLKELC